MKKIVSYIVGAAVISLLFVLPASAAVLKIGAVLAVTGPAAFLGGPEDVFRFTVRLFDTKRKDGADGQQNDTGYPDANHDVVHLTGAFENRIGRIEVDPDKHGAARAVIEGNRQVGSHVRAVEQGDWAGVGLSLLQRLNRPLNFPLTPPATEL